ncbi:efflux RND transporter permease subunit [Edaphobacter aggregans]|uniref:efflux RND transporter permease subunit n=1 Tax=Edaphobacter aggregans TaxID=570835 RepID=UPI000550EFD8|nr:efflux RND transporter permease subunit [Edaphobacter aggregans]
MSPSRAFILRPVTTALLMVAILIAGAAAYIKLPVSALPEVEYPTIQVRTFYPGASPDVMSSAVTAPLERQFGQIPGLTQMTSTSSDGSSAIVLQFSLRLNIDVAEQEVQAAINAAQSFLPTDLPVPPVYSKSNPADAPVLTLALTSKTMALSKVEDLADSRLAPKISQLSGVGLVTIGGGQKPAVRIQVNPATLATYGIGLEDLRSALASTSVNAAKGTFDGDAQNYQINANDQLLSGNDYRDVLVAYRNGAPVTLSDVATISDGVENTRLAGWMNHTPAVILNIQRQPGANTIAVVKSIEELLPQLQANLPASVKLTVLTDRTTTIQASVKDVEFELALTIGLVIMVIFVFLRNISATIIPAIAIPISLIGTMAVMYLLGYSLNNLTLMALTISTGFVVDDAIVMIENISRYLEDGLRPLDAALKGAEQIGFTIISLTISLIAVLIPLLLMGDIVGRLFREFAITLAVTILISAAVSLTLTPMMSARLLHHKPRSKQGAFYRWSEKMFEVLIERYSRTLRWVLRHEVATLLVAGVTLVLAINLYVVIPKGLFPTQDVGIIQGISQAPESISFQSMSRKQQELAKVILQDPAVASLSSFIGVDGTNATLNSGRIQINLKPFAERHVNAATVIDRLHSKLDRVDGIHLYMQPVQDLTVDDRASRNQFQYTLVDADQAELDIWTAKMVDDLKKQPELRDVATDQQPRGLAENLVIDRATASRMNITPDQIDSTLYDAFGQRQISTLYTQFNQYHVILEASPEFQRSPQKLQDIYLQNSSQQSGTSSASTSGRTGANSTSTSVSAFSVSSTSGISGAQRSAASGSVSTSALSSNTLGGLASTWRSTSSVLSMSGTSGLSATTSQPSSASSGGSSSNATSPIPLSAIAHFEKRSSPLTIAHQGQFPVVTISFNLAPHTSLSQAIAAVERTQRRLTMPASVQASFQGTAEAYKSVGSNEALLILAALAAVYIVLGILYESFIHPITILSTLPSAGVGALLALMLFGQDLGIVAIIGIILLIGIVKKNGIMIVDFALDAERTRRLTSTEAIYEASLHRFRPIMMTTLAALLAGIPLAFGSGIGSELRRPLGIAMVGGLLLSQVLTLYTTPVVYIFFDRLGQRLGSRKSSLMTFDAEGQL